MSADTLASSVKLELISLLRNQVDISEEELSMKIKIVAADRMLENWILADREGVKVRSELIVADASQQQYDGTNGTNKLKQLMRTSYKKTSHAQLLLKAINLTRAQLNSPSFKSFTKAIEL